MTVGNHPSGQASFDVVAKRAGGATRYQFIVFLLLTLVKFFPGMMCTLPVLIAYKQDYECVLPSNTTDEIPGNGTIVLDQCFIYRNNTPSLKLPCNSWTFDTSQFTSTIRSRYLLVCGRSFLAELSSTLFFLGYMCGSVGYGLISDRFGRLVGILTSAVHVTACAYGAAFSPTYWLFAICRFLAGIGTGGLYGTAFTMMAEVSDQKRRVIYGELVHNGFSYGVCIMSLIGYFQRDSANLQIIVASMTLSVFLLPLIIVESPRWLYTTGRTERAKKALLYINRFNKRRKKSVDLRLDAEEEEVLERKEEKVDEKDSMGIVLRERPLLFTTVINWFSWFAASVGFFATIFTLGDLGGNIFITLCISSMVEVPGRFIAIFTARRWGRIVTIGGSLVGGGLGCLLNSILVAVSASTAAIPVQVFSILNKFWMAIAFDTIWMYSSELFPTVIRNVGLGSGSMMARIGGMLAPQISLLFDVWRPLPLIIMGIVPCLSGALCFLLPETKKSDTLEDISDMVQLVVKGGRVGKPRRNSRFFVSLQPKLNIESAI